MECIVYIVILEYYMECIVYIVILEYYMNGYTN